MSLRLGGSRVFLVMAACSLPSVALAQPGATTDPTAPPPGAIVTPNDAPPTSDLAGAPGTVYQPNFAAGGERNETGLYRFQVGNFTGRTIGNRNDFISFEAFGGLFINDQNGLLFMDGRLISNDYDNTGTNVGGGLRQYVDGIGAIVGANAFYDLRDTGKADFDQFGFGLEALGTIFEWRANAYVPVNKDSNVTFNHIGVLIGNNVYQTATYQSAFRGFDTEAGAVVTRNEYVQTKLLAGIYGFEGDEFQDVWGGKVRGEAEIGNFTRLSLSANRDDLFKTTVMFGVELSFPSLNGRTERTLTNRVGDRLGDRVDRLQNIVIAEKQKLVDTGSQVFFLDNGAGGNGNFAAPQTTAQLLANPDFGPNDVVVLLDRNGTIQGNIILNQPNQQAVGSPTAAGVAVIPLPNGVFLTLSGLGGRPTLDGQVQMTNTSRISGFDIDTLGGNALVSTLAQGQSAVVTDVNILNAGNHGVFLNGMNGTFSFLAGATGGLIDNARTNGFFIENSSGNVFLDNVTIANSDVNALRTNNFSGLLQATGTTNITGAMNQSISIQNSTGSFEFGDLNITDGTDGISLFDHDGNFTVFGNTVLDSTGDHGVLATNTSSGAITFFGDLTITDTHSAGISLNGHNGSFSVGGTTTLTDTGDQGIRLFNNSNTDLSFGALNISQTHTAGISLHTSTGSFTATGPITVNDTGDQGLLAQNFTGDITYHDFTSTNNTLYAQSFFNYNGTVTSTGTTSATGGQTGILVQNSNADFNYQTITSTGAAQYGVSLFNLTGDFTANGTTTITGGQTGLLIQNSTGDYSFETLNVSGTSQYGVSLHTLNGSFTATGGNVTVTGMGNNAFLMQNSVLDVTLTDMIFSSNATDVYGLVTLFYSNGGSAALNNVQANFTGGTANTIGFRFQNLGSTDVQVSGAGNTSNANTPAFSDGGNFDGSLEVNAAPFTP